MKTWWKIALFFSIGIPAGGQEISFSNLNTGNGLSDNFIRSLEVDRNGFLWIGTNEGLNRYDGYSVTNYSKDENPGIPSKTIYHLFCDSKNRVWLGSAEGAAWADDKRFFHRVILQDSITDFACPSIFETRKYGIVLFTSRGQFYLDEKKMKWVRIDWIPPTLDFTYFTDITPYGENQILFSTDSAIILMDFAAGKSIWQMPMKRPASACKVDKNKIAVVTEDNHMRIVEIPSGKITANYNFTDYTSPPVKGLSWVEVRMGADGNILFASDLQGFFIIDRKGKITRYTHQPTNSLSIAGNKAHRILGRPNGDIIVGTERYGVSIANVIKKQAGYQKFFWDAKGNYFDGYLSEMAEDKDGTYWIGAADRLIHWDKEKNLSVFYQYYSKDSSFFSQAREPYRLCLDKDGRLWTGIYGDGLALFDKKSGQFNMVIPRDASNPAVKSRYIYDITQFADGILWIATRAGIYSLDPATKKPDTLRFPMLTKAVAGNRCNAVAEDGQQRVWVTTNGKGLFCYDKKNNSVRNFTKNDGLLDNVCLDMLIAHNGNVFVSMYTGFSMISPEGRIHSFSRANGLRFDKADAFLEDNDGMIWVSNAKCLLRFDPVTFKMDFFDEHENLNNGGFKPSSSLKKPDGELLWGTQSGINYFYPEQLSSLPEPLQVSIYRVQAGDSLFPGEIGEKARIRYRNNNLQFDFAGINLRGSRNIRYQYRLVGYDPRWQEGTDIRQARYSSLPPGDYTFQVRASADRNTWVESGNNFEFTIIAPLYMRGWFKLTAILLVTGLLIFIFQLRSRQLRQKKEELETEQAVNYFASSLYQYQTVDEILWDVARNCIGRLQFEDCVVYLLDEKKKVLVQKAAHGPKSPRTFEITRPIDIPLGKGIVGAVAANGKAEIIPDTSKDSRYIVDDEARLSEISVPILSGNQVLGVIDCEHSKKRFFTQKHLSILTTIASLCANKIIRAKTEEEKKQAEMMLAETKQKVAEAEMQALRAQMNPHFIFNCLNSINRYIVKSDQATASLYLTRFSKLIRLILDNSNSKNVILSNELEALRLYIEMESLRFDNKFTFDVRVEEGVNPDRIEIPPLIIQPYVENAIWHGLLHKAEGGHLSIKVGLLSDSLLRCIIEDNGVGRDKAQELKSKSVTKKKSLGMELTENRLLLLNKYAEVHSSVEILDLKDERQQAIGTKVILKIPIGE